LGIEIVLKFIEQNKMRNLALTFGVLASYIYFEITRWPPLRMSQVAGDESVMDMKSVIRASNCYREIGNKIYENNDPYSGCYYIYGKPLIQFFNFFHVDLASALVISRVLEAVVLVILTYQGCKTKKNKTFNYLIILSPPIWLLFERGNLDMLIFTLTFISILLLKSNKILLAYIFLFLGSIVKFYTYPLLIYFIFIKTKFQTKVFVILLFILATISIFSDILRIKEIPSLRLMSYGLSIYSFWIKTAENHSLLSKNIPSTKLVGYIVGIILSILLYFIYRKLDKSNRLFNFKPLLAQFSNIYIFLIMTLAYCMTFLFSTNVDYRLVFLVSALIEIDNLNITTVEKRIFYILGIVATWATLFWGTLSYNNLVVSALTLIGNIAQHCLFLLFISIFIIMARKKIKNSK
jgi:hypothetical protein